MACFQLSHHLIIIRYICSGGASMLRGPSVLYRNIKVVIQLRPIRTGDG